MKIAFDPGYGAISPGKLLFARILEGCCADQEIQQIDLVSPVPWLTGWITEPVPLQLAYVNLGRWRGRLILRLLRFRFGLVRRCAAWLRSLRPESRRRPGRA